MTNPLNAEYLNMVIDATCDAEGLPIVVVARCMACWQDFHIDGVLVDTECPVHGVHTDGYAEPISFNLLEGWVAGHRGPIVALRHYER